MRAFTAESINDVYPTIIADILEQGHAQFIERPEAIDNATMELHPAVVEIMQPARRLITSYGRPVNVAFALAEVLWILGGRDDVAMLEFYNSQIAQFSDDGLRFNAAYGRRLRHGFDHDQIDDVIHTLLDDPTSRQATLVITHPVDDKGWLREPVAAEGGNIEMAYIKKVTKDRACNLIAHPMIRNGQLDWLQVLRSNDAVWGVPYNMMQWTHLQEWIATVLGVEVGHYTFIADSLHIYERHRTEAEQIAYFDLYALFGDHAPMTRADTETLNILLREESIIREANQPWRAPANLVQEKVGPYWQSVLSVLAAHWFYKQNRDEECIDTLFGEVDPIYSHAQARFYHQNRWHKDQDTLNHLTNYVPPDTELWEWMTTRVES